MRRAGILRALGYRVNVSSFSPAEVRRPTEYPVDAVVIDLSRLPSQGRDVALFLRQAKASRHIPLVFVEGDKDKVARIRSLLPDATYATWSRIHGTLARALSRPPKAPVVPGVFAAYAGAAPAKKLGIKPESVVVLVGAPAGFERSLGPLPPGAAVHRTPRRPGDLTLWFVRSQRELERQIRGMRSRAASAGLWILWPKRTSGMSTDLTQNVVRRVGLGAGLVDFKISAVDATWSGLRFTLRKAR